MLKKDTIQKIATYLKIKDSDLETAIKDEKEVDLAVADNLQVLTAEELETRDTNQKNEGIKTGKEIGVKEVRKAAGIDEGGSKDPGKVAQAIIDKAIKDAKVPSDEKVSQLTEQVTLLQQQINEKNGEIENSKKAASQATLDRKIMAAFPKERTSLLTDDEILTLIKAGYSFKEQDGTVIVEKDGKPMRDTKTTNPMALGDAIGSIFSERKWNEGQSPVPGGRGGGDGKPAGGYTKLSELKKNFADSGKSLLGEEFSNAVKKAATDNKDFDMNS